MDHMLMHAHFAYSTDQILIQPAQLVVSSTAADVLRAI